MNEYTLEKCSLYTIHLVKNTPIVVFNDHNMALPIWGTFASRIDNFLNLVTFDTHTDTHPPFNAYLQKLNILSDFNKDVFEIPIIKKLMKDVNYETDNFCFEDVFKLSCSYISNTEHIITACLLDYLSSYTVIHRNGAEGFEDYDIRNGLNAKYINAENLNQWNVTDTHLPIALDFDLDYFRNKNDMSHEFFEYISPLIKHSSVITIAREPRFFESAKTDSDFTVEEAERTLIQNIESVLIEEK